VTTVRPRKREINVVTSNMRFTSNLLRQWSIEQRRCRYDIKRKTEQVRAGLLKSVKIRVSRCLVGIGEI
jgi:hypothetical protein